MDITMKQINPEVNELTDLALGTCFIFRNDYNAGTLVVYMKIENAHGPEARVKAVNLNSGKPCEFGRDIRVIIVNTTLIVKPL